MDMEIPYTSTVRPDTGLYNGKLGMWVFLASEVMLFGALFSSYVLLRVGAEEGTWPHGLLNVPIGAFNTLVLITSSVTVALSWLALKAGDFMRYRNLQLLTLTCAALFLGVKSWEYSEKLSHYEVWLKTPLSVEAHPELKGHVGDDQSQVHSVIGHIEGAGMGWTLATLTDANTPSIEIHPDPYHYRISAREQGKRSKAAKSQHTSPSDTDASTGKTPHALTIPVSEIQRLSALVPAHSTYFATYFTFTGLHGLHVLGGAFAFAWILWPGARMWKSDPERYTNAVEATGLFWHFVDLIWIFLFPVLYLL